MCLCSSAAERDESTKNAYLTVLLLLLLLSCFSRVRLCGTPEKAAHQAPPSLGFSRQEYWSGLPLPSPHSAAMSTQRLHYAYMYGELSTVQRGALLLVSSLLFPLVLVAPCPCPHAFTSPAPTLLSLPCAPVLRLSLPKHSWTPPHDLPQKIPIPSPLDKTIMNISRKDKKHNNRAMLKLHKK